MSDDVLGKVKEAMDLGSTGVSILLTLGATIYKFLQERAGMTPAQIHEAITAENDATAKALSDAEKHDTDIYNATHPK